MESRDVPGAKNTSVTIFIWIYNEIHSRRQNILKKDYDHLATLMI